MTDHRDLFLATAAAALDAWDDPAVDDAWEQDSALAELTVGALVAHAARALSTVRRYLEAADPPPDATLVDAAGYLVAVIPDPDPSSSVNVGVRERAASAAADGHERVIGDARELLSDLRDELPFVAADHVLGVKDGVAMHLDEYLATRLVELVVHHDDIDVSVAGAPRRPLPDEAGAVAVATLAEVARRRTSTTAMVRALARRERAGDEPPRAL